MRKLRLLLLAGSVVGSLAMPAHADAIVNRSGSGICQVQGVTTCSFVAFHAMWAYSWDCLQQNGLVQWCHVNHRCEASAQSGIPTTMTTQCTGRPDVTCSNPGCYHNEVADFYINHSTCLPLTQRTTMSWAAGLRTATWSDTINVCVAQIGGPYVF